MTPVFAAYYIAALEGQPSLLIRTTTGWYSTRTVRDPWSFALSVAAPSGEVEEREKWSILAFDFAALPSGRTEQLPTESEEVYESCVV